MMNNKEQKSKITLDPIWSFITKDYKLKRALGEGSYGKVVQAKCR